MFILKLERCRYQLVGEEAFTVEPGLSEFARFPHASVAYLRPLLDQVRTCIPEHKRALTPLVLRATAGLRLLPERIANALLESVSRSLGPPSLPPLPHFIPHFLSHI